MEKQLDRLHQRPGLKTFLLPCDEGFSSSVVIQANRHSIKALGELLVAISEQAEDTNFNFDLSPDGAGSTYFKDGSELGIYVDVVE